MDVHPVQAAPIRLEKLERDFRDPQTALVALVTVRKEGCNGGVGNIRQGEKRWRRRWGMDANLAVLLSGTLGHARG
jgi:hypothetical protein